MQHQRSYHTNNYQSLQELLASSSCFGLVVLLRWKTFWRSGRPENVQTGSWQISPQPKQSQTSWDKHSISYPVLFQNSETVRGKPCYKHHFSPWPGLFQNADRQDKTEIEFLNLDGSRTVIISLGQILNIRLPSVRESLRKGILLLRVSHWDEIFCIFCITRCPFQTLFSK